MKKANIIVALFLSLFVLNSCEKNEDSAVITKLNYVGFESGFIIGADPTGTASQEIHVATSNTTSSDRTFNISVDESLTTADPSAYNVPNSVTVPANTNIGTFTVEVIGENVGTAGEDILALGFASEEGLLTSEPISLNLKQVCPNPELYLDITFDAYPEEIYWVITDSDDNTIYESAPGAYGAYDGFEGSLSRPLCLASGDYTFTVYDQYGDGAGPLSLTFDGTVLFSTDGAYGAGTAAEFTIP
ncbi:hypothetical protein [Gaetbulibacter saemankumensis]|uniref:hypothetical protein n=1 Tax=Gaetbulibacter saemankumensis TaxID=311208 RepID=UPI0004029924|nr:hypothetical protein [Gaetbulibacter saemankumensis]